MTTIELETKMTEKFLSIDDAKIHYLEDGEGDPILFLHSIPFNAHVWRKVFPSLNSLGRCIAPDLVGFGGSVSRNIEFTLLDHMKYIDKFIDALSLKNIVFVLHGWGSIIGLDYALRHPKKCKGIVFYESFLRSFSGEDVSLPFQEQIVSLTQQNLSSNSDAISFIEKLIPQMSIKSFAPQDIAIYTEPYKKEQTMKPILQYIQEMPKGDGKSEVDKMIANYSMQLTHLDVPKLLLYSIPGFITTMETVVWAKDNIPNIEVTDIGEGLHLAPETAAELMGETISVWLQAINQ